MFVRESKVTLFGKGLPKGPQTTPNEPLTLLDLISYQAKLDGIIRDTWGSIPTSVSP